MYRYDNRKCEFLESGVICLRIISARGIVIESGHNSEEETFLIKGFRYELYLKRSVKFREDCCIGKCSFLFHF